MRGDKTVESVFLPVLCYCVIVCTSSAGSAIRIKSTDAPRRQVTCSSLTRQQINPTTAITATIVLQPHPVRRQNMLARLSLQKAGQRTNAPVLPSHRSARVTPTEGTSTPLRSDANATCKRVNHLAQCSQLSATTPPQPPPPFPSIAIV